MINVDCKMTFDDTWSISWFNFNWVILKLKKGCHFIIINNILYYLKKEKKFKFVSKEKNEMNVNVDIINQEHVSFAFSLVQKREKKKNIWVFP